MTPLTPREVAARWKVSEKTVRITAAACRIGKTVAATLPPPARHHHIMLGLNRASKGLGLVAPDDQGFLTNTGRFVGRIEAWDIAKAADQIIGKTPCPGTLYSEDLW